MLYAAAAINGGLEPDIARDTDWWGAPAWECAYYAFLIYLRAAAERTGRTTRELASELRGSCGDECGDTRRRGSAAGDADGDVPPTSGSAGSGTYPSLRRTSSDLYAAQASASASGTSMGPCSSQSASSQKALYVPSPLAATHTRPRLPMWLGRSSSTARTRLTWSA